MPAPFIRFSNSSSSSLRDDLQRGLAESVLQESVLVTIDNQGHYHRGASCFLAQGRAGEWSTEYLRDIVDTLCGMCWLMGEATNAHWDQIQHTILRMRTWENILVSAGGGDVHAGVCTLYRKILTQHPWPGTHCRSWSEDLHRRSQELAATLLESIPLEEHLKSLLEGEEPGETELWLFSPSMLLANVPEDVFTGVLRHQVDTWQGWLVCHLPSKVGELLPPEFSRGVPLPDPETREILLGLWDPTNENLHTLQDALDAARLLVDSAPAPAH